MSFTIEEAVQVLSQKFLLQKGVVGVSHGSKELIIYVESEEAARKIPRTLMGFPTKTIVSGKFRVLSLPEAKAGRTIAGTLVNRALRLRPIPGGVSSGSLKVGAGTNAGRVIDKTTGLKMLLSCYHVFLGDVGDPIIQPGKLDGGRYPDDVIGYIERFIEIKPPPETNIIDACIARPVSQDLVSEEVLDIGIVNGIQEAKVGMKVKKSGRSCGLMEATVMDTNATIKVDGYSFGEAIFEDQIITSFFALPGDSGSIAVSADTNAAVGMIFAGSEVLSCINKITNIVQLLNIDIPKSAAPPTLPPTAAAYVLMPLFTGFLLLLGAKTQT